MGLSLFKNKKLKTATAMAVALLVLPYAEATAATLDYEAGVGLDGGATWGGGLYYTTDPTTKNVTVRRTGVEVNGSDVTVSGDTSVPTDSNDTITVYNAAGAIISGPTANTTYTVSDGVASGDNVNILDDGILNVTISGFDVGDITDSGVSSSGSTLNVTTNGTSNDVNIGQVTLNNNSSSTVNITTSDANNVIVDFNGDFLSDTLDINAAGGGDITAIFNGTTTTDRNIEIDANTLSDVDVTFNGDVTTDDFNIGEDNGTTGGNINVSIEGDLTYVDNHTGNHVALRTSGTSGDVRLSVSGNLADMTRIHFMDNSTGGEVYFRLDNTAGDAITIDSGIEFYNSYNGTGNLEIYGYDYTFDNLIGSSTNSLNSIDIRGYVDGNVGSVEDASNVTFNNDVYANSYTIGDATENNEVNVTFNNSISTNSITSNSVGVVTLGANTTNNITGNFTFNADGTLALEEGSILNSAGGIITSNANSGVVQILGDGVDINADIGDVTNSIERIDLFNGDTTELSGDIYVGDIRLADSDAGLDLTADVVDVSGDIQGGSYAVNPVSGDLVFTASQAGTVTFNDASTAAGQSADIAGNIDKLNALNIDYSQTGSNFDVVGFTDVGALTINNVAGNTVDFGGDVTVRDSDISITYATSGAGNEVTFGGDVAVLTGSINAEANVTFSGNVTVATDISVDGNTTFGTGDLTVGGDVSLTGILVDHDVTITGDTDVGSLYVSSAGSSGSGLTFDGDVVANTGNITIVDSDPLFNTNTVTFTKGIDVLAGALSIDGNTTVADDITAAADITINGDAIVGGGMSTTGTITLTGGTTVSVNGIVNAGSLVVNDNASSYTFANNVTVTNDLVIDDATVTFQNQLKAGNIQIDGGTLNGDIILDGAGGIYYDENMGWVIDDLLPYSLLKDTTIGGSISGSADILLSSSVVQGDVKANNVMMQGTSELQALVEVTNLVSDGTNTLGTTVKTTESIYTLSGSTTTFNGFVASDVDINLQGNTTFNSDVTAEGNLNATGTVTIDNSYTNITGDINYEVGSSLATEGFTADSIITAANININGGTHVFNETVTATGAIDINANGTFNGIVNADTLKINNNNTFNSTLVANTVEAYGTGTFNGSIDVTEFRVKDAGTYSINNDGRGELVFENNGTVILASGSDWDGDIVAQYNDFGLLQLEGNRTIDREVTSTLNPSYDPENPGSEEQYLNAKNKLAAVNVGSTGSTVEINSTIGAVDLQIFGEGDVNLNADIDSNVNFLANGELLVTDNYTIDGDIDSIGGSFGTLTFDASGEVTGEIGSTNAVATLNVNSSSTLTLAEDVNVGDFNIDGSSSVVFANWADLTATTIDSSGLSAASILFQGSSNVDANIGSESAIGSIVAGVTESSVVTFDNTADNVMNVDALYIGSGQVIVSDGGQGDAVFLSGGTLTIASGADWVGNISAQNEGQGRLELLGTRTVADTVSTNTIGTLAVADDGSVVTFNSTVNAETIEIMGTGSATFNVDTNGSDLLFAGDGAAIMSDGYNVLQTVDAAQDNIGTLTLAGDTEITGTIGANKTLGVLEAAANTKTVTLSEDVKVQTLTMLGDGTLTFEDGADLTVETFTANADGEGTVTFEGSSTINGDIATNVAQLKEIKGAYNNSTVVFNDEVHAETLAVEGTGRYSINDNGSGDILFNENGYVAIADNVTWTGSIDSDAADQGEVVFAGDANGITDVGLTSRINRILLAGDNKTVTTTGAFMSADNLYLGNNTLDVGSFSAGADQNLYTYITDASTWGNINSGGAINIDSNAILTTDVYTSEYLVAGSKFSVATGGAGSSIATLDDGVGTNNILLDFSQTGSGNLLEVELDMKDMNEVTNDPNLIAIGDVFFDIPYNQSEYIENVNIALQNAKDIGTVRAILEDFLPKVDGGEKSAVMNNNAQIQYLAEQRIEDIRMGNVADYGFTTDSYTGGFDEYGFEVQDFGSMDNDYYDYGFSGVSSGNGIYNASLWGQVYFNHITQSASEGISGYDSDSFGAAVGMDNSDIIDNAIVGVSFNMGSSTIDSGEDGNTDSDIMNYGINFYSNYEFSNDVFLNAQLGFSMNEIDRTRYNAGAIGSTATATYDSSQIGAKFALGADLFPVNGLTLTPVASISHVMIDTDGYSETGGVLNMTVSGHDEAVTRIGMKVDANLQMMDSMGAIIKPSMKFGYFYDIQNAPVETMASFDIPGSASFVTEGPEPDASTFLIGGGIDYVAETDWELATDVDYTYKDGYNSYTGIMRLTGYY